MASWKGKTRGGLTGYKIFIAVLRTWDFRLLIFCYVLLHFIFSLQVLNPLNRFFYFTENGWDLVFFDLLYLYTAIITYSAR